MPFKAIKTLRLILGDQLNARHSWYQDIRDDVLYVIAELPQEAHYVTHHIQKLCGFFLAMETFATALKSAGHQVLYLNLDDTQEYARTDDLLKHLIAKYSVKHLEYQRPDEYRLQQQLESMKFEGIETTQFETEHFLLPHTELAHYFKKDKRHRMESFYRKMRTRFNILMERTLDGQELPIGGRWNYDSENRKKLSKSDIDLVPQPLNFSHDVNAILERIRRHKIPHFGEAMTHSVWPKSRAEARQQLNYFCNYLLVDFGQFQDAMTENSPYQNSLYHSRLSFALNCKMISPMEVIRTVETAYYENDHIHIAQAEGFIRQILGWREFVRGLYWANMPDYEHANHFQHTRSLPNYFWTGKTNMNCLRHGLQHSLQDAYAHHIERLMVIGNFCLLTGIEPSEVDRWYLGVYMDAIQWVELPNTRGMSQFADGGLLASKPYISSGNYIAKMSDYCSSCHYNVKIKTGSKACPYNSFYWHFLEHHKDELSKNPRMAFAYKQWQKLSSIDRKTILQQAKSNLAKLEQL